MSGDAPSDRPGPLSLRAFAARTAIVVAAVGLAWLAWTLRHVLGLTFAAVVAAVVVDACARPLLRYTPLPRPAAAAVALALLIVAFALVAWWAAPGLSTQAGTLLEELPVSMQEIERQIGGWMEGSSSAFADAVSQVLTWSMSAVYAVTSAVLVVLTGAFLAADPVTYRDGLVRLFPRRAQSDLRAALDRTGHLLHRWLIGKLLTMTIIGSGIGVGAWLIGLPAAGVLGLTSGLLAFVPVIGPVVAAIPGLILAASMGTTTLLWTLALYVGVEQLESNLILPLVEGEAAGIRPALLILAFAVFGALLGILGAVIAAPLAVAIYALVKQLYLKESV